MKTIPEMSKREYTGASSENIGTIKIYSKEVDVIPRRSVGNLNTSMPRNEGKVVPIRFYGEHLEIEYLPSKIESGLKLKLQPLTTQVQAASDATLEALSHDFPNNETSREHGKNQKRPTSLSIEPEQYEVDYIAGARKANNETEYLIKWKGYAIKDSSWVSERNLEAPEILGFFRLKNAAQSVLKQNLRHEQENFTPFFPDKYDGRHRKRWELLEVEFSWNKIINREASPIFIENWSDKARSLPDFEYITKNRHSKDVMQALRNIGPDQLERDLGCVEGCKCNSVKNCCAQYYRIEVQNYNCGTNSKGIRTIKPTKSNAKTIVECGEHCKCDPTACRQRVLQKGRKLQLVLFWEGAKKWGLRTVEKIPKNAFVGEYVGEVISFEEAENSNRMTTYQFELSRGSPAWKDKPLVIDATCFGNETRFINHSCSPNLETKDVVTNKYSSYDFRIGFYSTRDIEPGKGKFFVLKIGFEAKNSRLTTILARQRQKNESLASNVVAGKRIVVAGCQRGTRPRGQLLSKHLKG